MMYCADGISRFPFKKSHVTLPGHPFWLRFIDKGLLLAVRDTQDNLYVLNHSQALE